MFSADSDNYSAFIMSLKYDFSEKNIFSQLFMSSANGYGMSIKNEDCYFIKFSFLTAKKHPYSDWIIYLRTESHTDIFSVSR